MKWLENGYNVGIIPGGSREALYADPDYDCLDLRRKRGFVRLAIMYGVDLVPVFTFNENDQYEQVRYTNMPTILNDIRQLLIQNTTGICLPFLFHLLPRKGTILTTVVGEPIKVTSNPSPTEEEVSKLMDLYISKLEELYNKHGPIYNSKPKKLIIL
jgi:1-acyl-sn-glycerol-3-phosphate acyltransferase